MRYFIIVVMLSMTLFAACVSSIPSSNNTGRFVDNNDGTISDNKTGLVWKQDSFGAEHLGDGVYSDIEVLIWSDALYEAEAYSDDNGYTWRLPTIKELNSLIERSCAAPALLPMFDYNSNIATKYWSSTHANASGDVYADTEAMIINFETGQIELQDKMHDSNITMRLVRIRQ